ncbi:hypothetical protein [Pseudonocardia sp. GCM10023141]|uniref:hypothetical protein n=1 Tax=Pseudonocardia sp. GCM10023141 TaxID=3252653 RepID=UPI00361DB1BA
MRTVIATARRGHAGLFGFAVVMAAATVVLAVVALFDQRTLLDAPLWLKPIKFTVSFTLYGATLAWMLGQLRVPAPPPRPPRRERRCHDRQGFLIMATSFSTHRWGAAAAP